MLNVWLLIIASNAHAHKGLPAMPKYHVKRRVPLVRATRTAMEINSVTVAAVKVNVAMIKTAWPMSVACAVLVAPFATQIQLAHKDRFVKIAFVKLVVAMISPAPAVKRASTKSARIPARHLVNVVSAPTAWWSTMVCSVVVRMVFLAMDLAAVNSHHNAATPTVSVTKRIPTAPMPVRAPKTAPVVRCARVENVAKSVAPDVIVHLVNSANAALVLLAAKPAPIVLPIKAASKVNAPIRAQISLLAAVMHSVLSPIIACFVTVLMATKVSPARSAYNLNVLRITTVNRINVVMRVNVATLAWNMARVVLMRNAVLWIASHNAHAHPITLAHPKPSVVQ